MAYKNIKTGIWSGSQVYTLYFSDLNLNFNFPSHYKYENWMKPAINIVEYLNVKSVIRSCPTFYAHVGTKI